MMDMLPTPIVHVHQASMEQAAPMTLTAVPQLCVSMEAPVWKVMAPQPHVCVHQGLEDQVV